MTGQEHCVNESCAMQGVPLPAATAVALGGKCSVCARPLEQVASGLPAAIERAIETYPYPIALPLQKLAAETTGNGRRLRLRDVFVGLIKYQAIVLQTEYLLSPVQDEDLTNWIRTKLDKPLESSWLHFTEAAVPVLSESGHELFVPELWPSYGRVQPHPKRKGVKRPKAKMTTLRKHGYTNEDGEFVKTSAKFGLFEALLKFRNDFSHEPALPDAEADEDAGYYLDIVATILDELSWLGDYTLYKREDGRVWRLMGVTPQECDFAWPEGAEQSLVLAAPDGRRHLPIFPLLLVPSEYQAEKQGDDQVLVYAGDTGKVLHYISPAGHKADIRAVRAQWARLLESKRIDQRELAAADLTAAEVGARAARVTRETEESLFASRKVLPGTYVPREEAERHLRYFYESSFSMALVTARAGSGKTCLLHHLATRWADAGHSVILTRASSIRGADVTVWLREKLGLGPDVDVEALAARGTSEARRLILVVDGINEHAERSALLASLLAFATGPSDGCRIQLVMSWRSESVEWAEEAVSYQNLFFPAPSVEARPSAEQEVPQLALGPWSAAEVQTLWGQLAELDKKRYRPQFDYQQLVERRRTAAQLLSNPLVLRTFLEVYADRPLPESPSRAALQRGWWDRLRDRIPGAASLMTDLARICMEQKTQALDRDALYRDPRTADAMRKQGVSSAFYRLEEREGVLCTIRGGEAEVAFTMDRYLEQAAAVAVVEDGHADTPEKLMEHYGALSEWDLCREVTRAVLEIQCERRGRQFLWDFIDRGGADAGDVAAGVVGRLLLDTGEPSAIAHELMAHPTAADLAVARSAADMLGVELRYEERADFISEVISQIPNPAHMDLGQHFGEVGVKALMDVIIRALGFRACEIYKLRCGVGDGFVYTSVEIARIFRISATEVQRIEGEIVERLAVHAPEVFGQVKSLDILASRAQCWDLVTYCAQCLQDAGRIFERSRLLIDVSANLNTSAPDLEAWPALTMHCHQLLDAGDGDGAYALAKKMLAAAENIEEVSNADRGKFISEARIIMGLTWRQKAQHSKDVAQCSLAVHAAEDVCGDGSRAYARAVRALTDAMLEAPITDGADAERVYWWISELRACALHIEGEGGKLEADALLQEAKAHAREGDYWRAQPLALRSAEILDEIYGPGHPEAAMACIETSEYFTAEDRIERLGSGLRILQAALGAEHPSMILAWGHVASAVEDIGDARDCREVYEDAACIRAGQVIASSKLYGSLSRQVVDALLHIGAAMNSVNIGDRGLKACKHAAYLLESWPTRDKWGLIRAYEAVRESAGTEGDAISALEASRRRLTLLHEQGLLQGMLRVEACLLHGRDSVRCGDLIGSTRWIDHAFAEYRQLGVDAEELMWYREGPNVEGLFEVWRGIRSEIECAYEDYVSDPQAAAWLAEAVASCVASIDASGGCEASIEILATYDALVACMDPASQQSWSGLHCWRALTAYEAGDLGEARDCLVRGAECGDAAAMGVMAKSEALAGDHESACRWLVRLAEAGDGMARALVEGYQANGIRGAWSRWLADESEPLVEGAALGLEVEHARAGSQGVQPIGRSSLVEAELQRPLDINHRWCWAGMLEDLESCDIEREQGSVVRGVSRFAQRVVEDLGGSDAYDGVSGGGAGVLDTESGRHRGGKRSMVSWTADAIWRQLVCLPSIESRRIDGDVLCSAMQEALAMWESGRKIVSGDVDDAAFINVAKVIVVAALSEIGVEIEGDVNAGQLKARDWVSEERDRKIEEVSVAFAREGQATPEALYACVGGWWRGREEFARCVKVLAGRGLKVECLAVIRRKREAAQEGRDFFAIDRAAAGYDMSVSIDGCSFEAADFHAALGDLLVSDFQWESALDHFVEAGRIYLALGLEGAGWARDVIGEFVEVLDRAGLGEMACNALEQLAREGCECSAFRLGCRLVRHGNVDVAVRGFEFVSAAAQKGHRAAQTMVSGTEDLCADQGVAQVRQWLERLDNASSDLAALTGRAEGVIFGDPSPEVVEFCEPLADAGHAASQRIMSIHWMRLGPASFLRGFDMMEAAAENGDEQAIRLMAAVERAEDSDAPRVLAALVEDLDNPDAAPCTELMLLVQRLHSRGEVTLGELSAALPDGMTDPESIEAAIAYIENQGLDVVE